MPQLFGLARLGRDCELRSTPNGDSVATLSLAFTYGRKGADGKKPVSWVEASLWGKRAEALAPYLLKGGLVVVTLKDVHIETFQKSDGTPALKLKGDILEIELAGGAPPQQAAPPQRAPAPPPVQQRRAVAPVTGTGFDDMDSDIPF